MLRRRGFVGGGLLAVFLSQLAVAARAASDWFSWINPGRAPYKGTVDEALDTFVRTDGEVFPSDVANEAKQLVRQGRGERATIAPRLRHFTMMMFTLDGRHKVVTNVWAVLERWGAGVPRGATVYTIVRGYRVYMIVIPDVCGNVSLVVLDQQQECVQSRAVCADCGEIRALQQ